MGTGYTRNDTANNIADGNIINASDLDGEFDAVQSAFDASTGHTHDGTAGEGAPIETIGPSQDVVATASVLRPKTDNTVDLGTTSLEYKDLFLDGTAHIDTLDVDENASITGTLGVTGTTTLGTANITTGTITTADINGGNIDGTIIGATTAAAITGTTITGTSFVTSGDMTFGDNDKAVFGAGSDLRIYHDGSQSFVQENGTGQLVLDTQNGARVKLTSNNGTENMVVANKDGDVELYYDNAQKLATTSTGVDITGTLTSDGLTVDGNIALENADFITFKDTGGSNRGILTFDANNDIVIGPAGAGIQDIKLKNNGAKTRLNIDVGGDVSFYEDTGTTAKLTWDASDESLNFADNGKAIFGAGSDLQIYHDGSASYIDDAGTGALYIRGNAIVLEKYTGERLLDGTGDAAVKLYYDNAVKLATTSTGVDITGTLTSDDVSIADTSPTLLFNRTDRATDNKIIRFAHDGEDFQLQLANDAVSSVTPAIAINRTGMSLDSIAFYEDTGTTAKFFWDASAERLGVGTTTPNAPVDSQLSGGGGLPVSSGTAQTYGSLRVGATSFNTILDMGSAGASGAWLQASDKTALGTNYPLLLNPNGGNVGIGTDAPQLGSAWNKVLHIHSSSGSGSHIRLTDPTSGETGESGLYIGQYGVDSYFINRESGKMLFVNNGSERMRIDSSGNVTVNSNGSVAALDGISGIQVGNSAATTAGLALETSNRGYLWYIGSGTSDLKLWDSTANSDRLTIDSSGIALFGKTVVDNTTKGIQIDGPSGFMSVARDAGIALLLDRSNDGEIQRFTKDGATVGSIGTLSGSPYFAGTGTGIRPFSTGIVPTTSTGASADGTRDLGTSSVRFKDLYLSGGVYLGGTGSANLLDDFEEGQFDVTISPATSGTISISTSYDKMRYTKVGNIVHFQGEIRVASVSSPVGGDVKINNLPFTSINGTDFAGRIGGATYYYQASSTSIQVKAFRVVESDNKIRFAIDASTVTANDEFAFNFTYTVA